MKTKNIDHLSYLAASQTTKALLESSDLYNVQQSQYEINFSKNEEENINQGKE